MHDFANSMIQIVQLDGVYSDGSTDTNLDKISVVLTMK